MPPEKTLLVLHGMTMSGASMLRCMAPLAAELEKEGFVLLAPDAPHELSERELEQFLSWVSPVYEARGRDPQSAFRKGVFWDDGPLCDWLSVETNPTTGIKTYHALERTLDTLARATAKRDVVGIFGFSQGAILATLLEALGAQGDTRFPARRFGIYVAGSPPGVHEPVSVEYPIASSTKRLLVAGGRDPFFDGEASLAKWAEAFTEPSELYFDPDLGHRVPADRSGVKRMMEFVRAHSA